MVIICGRYPTVCSILLWSSLVYKQLHILGNLGFVNGKTDKSQKLKSCSQNLNSNTDMSSAATVHEMTFLSSLQNSTRPCCHLGILFYFIVVHTMEVRSIWFTKHNSPFQIKLVFLVWHCICQSRTYARVRVSCLWEKLIEWSVLIVLFMAQ